jgi:hypothetical protein
MAQRETTLDKDVRKYKEAAYASNTKSAYASQLRKYIDFCNMYNYQSVPASSDVICRYVAHLAQTMCSNSVRQYLNVIRILHLENGYDNPLQDDFALKLVLKGVQRVKGMSVRRKLPITLNILQSICRVLNLDRSQDLAFWSACLIAFFGMLRKSSLFPRKAPEGHMCLSSCTLHSWGLEISLVYSKTVQFQERRPFVALPWNSKDKFLCPVATLLKSLKVAGCCQASDYIFKFIQGSKQHEMTYTLFTTMLRQVLVSLNLSTTEYSGHSFRRGGATCALHAGLPAEVVKAQGDWKSLAYLDYVDQPQSSDRADYISKMY